jgi:hypothetical protein
MAKPKSESYKNIQTIVSTVELMSRDFTPDQLRILAGDLKDALMHWRLDEEAEIAAKKRAAEAGS